jgi:methylated-DNA-protein-cysteine methyltransferase-like protein
MTDIFTTRVRDLISQIPRGKVMSYGLIARYAGNPSGARQVARVLYSSSEKYQLPWHRVVNRNGQISPRPSMGHLFQRKLLEEEGVVFGGNGRIDFAVFLWRPEFCA